MSIASSAASSVSVSLNGREMCLEEALDEVVRGLQGHLNMVQCHLRTLASDQERGNEFEEMIATADLLEDNIDEMQWLFQDLRSMCYEICGEPETPEERSFLKAHKIERKAYFQKKALDRKAEAKKLKQESKENKMSED